MLESLASSSSKAEKRISDYRYNMNVRTARDTQILINYLLENLVVIMLVFYFCTGVMSFLICLLHFFLRNLFCAKLFLPTYAFSVSLWTCFALIMITFTCWVYPQSLFLVLYFVAFYFLGHELSLLHTPFMFFIFLLFFCWGGGRCKRIFYWKRTHGNYRSINTSLKQLLRNDEVGFSLLWCTINKFQIYIFFNIVKTSNW